MDLMACQPIWAMLCRKELAKFIVKMRPLIIILLSVYLDLKMIKF